MTVYLVNDRKDKVTEYPDRAVAEEQRSKLIELGMGPENVEIKANDPTETKADGGNAETHSVEVAEKTAQEAEVINNPEKLSTDPIGFLESVNNDFVNTIKGKPAISKQGFRFIQREFGITTEAEVVETLDDPTGVIVWAKATLPDGHSAEAHGEGWLFESDVDDNEFVRYADTRAKNRALSDLTSAGALAVSELTGEE